MEKSHTLLTSGQRTVRSPEQVRALTEIEEALNKPRFRGIPDLVAIAAFTPLVIDLLQLTYGKEHFRAFVTYGICLMALFSVSALYHTFTWPTRIRERWKSVDHIMIYVMIAGSYMPLCALGLPQHLAEPLRACMWMLTALGAGKTLLWPNAPRAFSVSLYVGMGIVILPFVPALLAKVSVLQTALLLLGGALYITGAVVYARKWPNPDPRNFGWHEVFHLFVIAAAASHFACVLSLAQTFTS